MNVHNQVEEAVFETVAQICDEIERIRSDTICVCDQCRLDVACYVLNRVPARYVVSERGFAQLAVEHDAQQAADLIALVKQGVEQVARAKRPHFPHRSDHTRAVPEGPCFEFPVIGGRLFNGRTFEPLCGAEVELLIAGRRAEMANPNWQNPLPLVRQADGHYSFWPRVEQAEAAGEQRVFDLNLVVRADDFEDVEHFFQLSLTATTSPRRTTASTFSISALYAFPE